MIICVIGRDKAANERLAHQDMLKFVAKYKIQEMHHLLSRQDSIAAMLKKELGLDDDSAASRATLSKLYAQHGIQIVERDIVEKVEASDFSPIKESRDAAQKMLDSRGESVKGGKTA